MSVFGLLLARESRLLFRRPAELANPLIFFAIVIHCSRWPSARKLKSCKTCPRG